MTQQSINTFQDILDALESSPEIRAAFHRHMVKAIRSDEELRRELRQEILTEELLQLPVRFTAMEQDVKQLKEDVQELKEDMIQVKGRLDSMDSRLDSMDGRLDGMDGRLDSIESHQLTMSGRIANLTGNDYERRAIEQSRRLVRNHLDMLKASVIHAAHWESHQINSDLFVDTVLAGRITKAEAAQLEDADCIVRCEDEAGNVVHAVVEISVAVQDEDRRRAIERASILAKAVNSRVLPFTVGQREEPPTGNTANVVFLEYAPSTGILAA